jgi:hypothetical protein
MEKGAGGMSMQIGSLLRHMIGDLQPADAKTLELKVGQVVKGIVLQLLADGEALVGIGGVQVRARLEAPLQPGQSTWLQVQPESTAAQTVLRPVPGSNVPLAGSELDDLIGGFPAKDRPAVRRLAERLQRAEVAPTKHALEAFRRIAEQAPAGEPADAWLEAAIVAHKRNLPLTRETVQSLREAMFGRPLLERLDALEAHAAAALREAPEPAGGSGELQALLQRLRQAIARVREAVGAGDDPADAATAHAAARGRAEPPAGEAGPALRARPGDASAAPAQAQPPAAETARHAAASPQAAGAEPRGDGMRAAGGAAAKPGAGDAAPAERPQASAAEAGARAAAGAHAAHAAGGPQAERGVGGAAAGAERPAAGKAEPHWIARLFQAVGLEHEHHVARAIERAEHWGMAASGRDADVAPAQADADRQQLARSHPAADSLKSVLLQLSGSDAVPEPLREQAQQTLQQVTGQQLLLAADRGSVLTHVTLLLPMRHADGGQAAIHVQSRKSGRGGIDAHNCRLLFDLNMKTMGATLLDVHVYDRNVYVNMHNDLPFVGELLNSHRDEIEEGLQRHGYRLASLKCAPFPQPPAETKSPEAAAAGATDSGPAESSDPAAAARRTQASAAYHIKPYKSVDVRV